jgi:glycosyltransferase involved in cell wall biosynthesis
VTPARATAETTGPMRITFLLPGAGREPVGGFKVVYEYANHLTARGHTVTVVHTSRAERELSRAVALRRAGTHAARKLTRTHGPAPWFALSPRVRLLWVPSLGAAHVPDGDAVVATAWQTAEWAGEYPKSKGKRFYLIQHLETWAGPEDRVMATWKLPLEKIVIARWLQETAESLGERSHYIPNGLDFAAFGPDVPPESRRADSFLMLHHRLPWKGSQDGILALREVLERHRRAAIRLFGTGPRPRDLPGDFAYERAPTPARLRALYNEAAVFVAPSRIEGWGLPPAEAMMCGCALAATDTGGHREFAVPGETALLSPPSEPAALAANVLRLIEDTPLRIRLAHAGLAQVGRFTWDRATDALEGVLRSSA